MGTTRRGRTSSVGRANEARQDADLVRWARSKQIARREGDGFRVPEAEINRVVLLSDGGVIGERTIPPMGDEARSSGFMQAQEELSRAIGRASRRHAILVGGLAVLAIESRHGKSRVLLLHEEAATLGVARVKEQTP